MQYVTKEKFEKICDLYFSWKNYDQALREESSRGANIPEAVTEIFACYALDFMPNHQEGGDASMSDGSIVEIKATSSIDGRNELTSFSPGHPFKCLIFVWIDKENDLAKIYDLGLNSDTIRNIQITKTQTFGNQQDQARRPRFSVIKSLIRPQKLEPIKIINIRQRSVKSNV